MVYTEKRNPQNKCRRNLGDTLLALLFLSLITNISAQVKIGDNPETINPASLLELQSTSKTLVLPRVSNAEMNAILPLNGALIYNVDEKCIFYYDDDSWNNLCDVTNGSDGNDGDDGGNGEDNDDDNDDDVPNVSGISITEDGEIIYTYINEDGEETIITLGESGVLHVGGQGSVFFAGTNGVPTEDNENLFWDNSNKRMGVGTSTPKNDLHVAGIIRAERINNTPGTAAFPGYHFTGNFNSGLFSPKPGQLGITASGNEIIRVTANRRVGIQVTDPQATLHVGGDLRVDGNIIEGAGKSVAKKAIAPTPIRRLSEDEIFLTLSDHTLVLEKTVEQLILPQSNASNIGHIYILKDLGGKVTELNLMYRDFKNKPRKSIKNNETIWLQSDGVEWQQIN